MKGANRLSMACAFGLLAASGVCQASPDLDSVKEFAPQEGVRQLDIAKSMMKSASARTVASRATSTSAITVYGGFELASSAIVYILVRGNSLGTLGVTQGYLDAPRVRLYNSAGTDLIQDGNGRAGFNGCLATNTTTDLPVINYYSTVRGQPANSRDSCIAVSASAGAFTFSVTPSIPGVTTTSTSSLPSAGEILFEVTLGP